MFYLIIIYDIIWGGLSVLLCHFLNSIEFLVCVAETAEFQLYCDIYLRRSPLEVCVRNSNLKWQCAHFNAATKCSLAELLLASHWLKSTQLFSWQLPVLVAARHPLTPSSLSKQSSSSQWKKCKIQTRVNERLAKFLSLTHLWLENHSNIRDIIKFAIDTKKRRKLFLGQLTLFHVKMRFLIEKDMNRTVMI